MELQGKVALVTGGASGIGLAIVEELLVNGVRVAICDVDTQAGTTVLEAFVNQFGENRVIFIEMDVQDQNSFEAAFRKTYDVFMSLDILVNNAGIGEFEGWEELISINLGGVVRGSKLAMEYMNKQKNGSGGVVVNMASIFGLTPTDSAPVYTAAKHGVVGLSRSLGMSLHFDQTGVRVLTLCPGVTTTPLLNRARKYACTSDIVAARVKMLNAMPMQSAEVVAKAVLHIIQHASNGSVWVCEGGAPVYEVHIPSIEEMKISA